MNKRKPPHDHTDHHPGRRRQRAEIRPHHGGLQRLYQRHDAKRQGGTGPQLPEKDRLSGEQRGAR
ncbi:hypothetical protein AERO8C_20251 [Aeromonas veronii]|uniref:Uncharacterized protein n=1 Tax=Aeromonas veronii TaxID=654 RepID=A0A653L1F7_AERVE|nr:hypothetical protein AERO8C_20251 [Aeromonas veronii]